MERSVFKYAPWIILFASFAVLAVCYTSLPSEVVITRSVLGGSETLAPRSLFTVFRVPLIELACALAVLVMLERTISPRAERSHRSMWVILLFTVSLKSLFQSLEMVSSPPADMVFFCTTIAVVLIGVVLALIQGRRAYIDAERDDWKLSSRQKLELTGLLVMYLGVAIVPILVFRS